MAEIIGTTGPGDLSLEPLPGPGGGGPFGAACSDFPAVPAGGIFH